MSNGRAGRWRANGSSWCSRRRRPHRPRRSPRSSPGMPWSAAPAEPLCDAAVAVVAARWGMETPLTAVAEVFEELASGMEADGGELRLAPFGDTCALVSVLFSCLGIAFEFAEIEYVTKEAKDNLLGRLFGFGSLARSGRVSGQWTRDKCSPIVKDFVSEVVKLGCSDSRFGQEGEDLQRLVGSQGKARFCNARLYWDGNRAGGGHLTIFC